MDESKKREILDHRKALMLEPLNMADEVYDFIEAWVGLADNSNTLAEIELKKRDMILSIYRTEMLRKTTEEMSISNEKLANSNKKRSTITLILSSAMVLLALAQVYVAWLAVPK